MRLVRETVERETLFCIFASGGAWVWPVASGPGAVICFLDDRQLRALLDLGSHALVRADGGQLLDADRHATLA
jgi:hypothetical protein